MKKSIVILTLILLASITFSQEKPKVAPTPKDTVVYILKSEMEKNLIEDAQKQINQIQAELLGVRKLLMIMPDSIQVRQKKQ